MMGYYDWDYEDIYEITLENGDSDLSDTELAEIYGVDYVEWLVGAEPRY